MIFSYWETGYQWRFLLTSEQAIFIAGTYEKHTTNHVAQVVLHPQFLSYIPLFQACFKLSSNTHIRSDLKTPRNTHHQPWGSTIRPLDTCRKCRLLVVMAKFKSWRRRSPRRRFMVHIGDVRDNGVL